MTMLETMTAEMEKEWPAIWEVSRQSIPEGLTEAEIIQAEANTKLLMQTGINANAQGFKEGCDTCVRLVEAFISNAARDLSGSQVLALQALARSMTDLYTDMPEPP